jgi:dihydroxy-acid dehydratase
MTSEIPYKNTSDKKADGGLRSQSWFDDRSNPDMTALYIERYLNYGLTRQELQSGKPIIGIAQTGSDLAPCNRHHLELAWRVKDGIREAGGIPRSTRSRKPASAPPRRSTATCPISDWWKCSTGIRSTASC